MAKVREEAPNAAQDELTDEERWGLIFGAVNIYYGIDAGVALGVTAVSFAGSLIARAVFASDCANNLWVPSLIMLVVRWTDAACMLRGIWKDPIPGRRTFLCDILRNMAICFCQGVLGLTSLIMAIVLLAGDHEGCAVSGIVGCISGALLIAQALEEFCIWVLVLGLWCFSGSMPIPHWVDETWNYLPEGIRRPVLEHQRRRNAAKCPA